MGKVLVDMYEEAKQIGKLNAQIRLAVLTSIPLNRAKDLPDTPDVVSVFKKAMESLKKEFKA